MTLELETKRINDVLRTHYKQRNRENLGVKWTYALNEFSQVVSILKKKSLNGRKRIGSKYLENSNYDPSNYAVFMPFFEKPKLKNLKKVFEIMPIMGNKDEADNLNLIVRGIRNIIDN